MSQPDLDGTTPSKEELDRVRAKILSKGSVTPHSVAAGSLRLGLNFWKENECLFIGGLMALGLARKDADAELLLSDMIGRAESEPEAREVCANTLRALVALKVPVPEELGILASRFMIDPAKNRDGTPPKRARDRAIVGAVNEVLEWFPDMKATRGTASAQKPGCVPSACSVVSEALISMSVSVGEAAVNTVWTNRKKPS